jgi:hypothetical protein
MPLFGTRGAASVTGFGGLAKLGYLLRNSLRFRASNSNYLNRTFPSAGNRKTYTLSLWVKRGNLGGSTTQFFFGSGLSTTAGGFYFTATDNIEVNPRVNNTNTFLTTTQVFRDPSAWYHIVFSLDTTQATDSNRMKLYVNGVQVTAFSSASYPALNGDSTLNNNIAHWIGRYAEVGFPSPFDGYLAEYNFIDGQALTPSSFGKTDPVTGQWIPIKYGSTYGTNGFYLPFTNTTSTSTLGNDFSGNGNTWTVNNFSLTAGVTYDSMTDVPTLTSATAANYCVLNPLEKNGGSVVDGNLNFTNGSATSYMVGSTIVPTGLCYAEFQPTGWGNGNNIVGLRTNLGASNSIISASGGVAYDLRYGTVAFNGTTQATYTAATGTSNVAMLAYDPSSGKLWFGLDGTWFNSGNPAAGTGQVYTITTPTDAWRIFVQSWDGTNAMSANFGQRPFAYTPPSGFKALNTFNLP